MSNSVKNLLFTHKRFVRQLLIAIGFGSVFLICMLHWYSANLQVSATLSIFTLFIIACILFISSHYKKSLQSQLSHLTELEKWADLSTVCDEIKPIPQSEAPLNLMIQSIYQQLQSAKNNDSHFDRLLRSNVLLDKETGVGNREFFNNRLEALLKEEDTQGAVFFIQCKDFDLVHTLYGEQQAITLLNTLVQHLRYRLQTLPNFFIARRGELELAVIVPDIFFHEAEKLAGKLVKSLSAITLPVGINKDEFIHIGVSYFSHTDNAYQVKSEADMALRTAQLQGPSQWFMYDAGEMEHAKAKGSLKWRTFLNHAINKNAFVIFFQPVISALNEQILHHEVLSKVRDSDGSLISARVFLPMAQKCGLTEKIDLLVLKQICRLLSYDKSQKDFCSLNLSIESLLSAQFVAQFKEVLSAYPHVHERLLIEVSEYHLANHLEQLKPTLSLLYDMGIKLLADKVGQYVVSAAYIKTCPIKYIKLHRSIVLDVHKKLENQIFIQSLRAMSEAHDVNIYALGVESLEEWQTLKRLGVNGGQGHFFTEPVAQVAKAIHLP